jgi:adenosylmethionine-8-amino-7-oxononanoate aminotransferase
MAAVDAALDVYVDEDVAGTVRVMSGHVQSRFRDEFMELDVVGDVDGEGLMLALEIVENTSTKARFGAETMARITSRSLDRGLITRARGSRLAFCPPLTITRDEADQALDIMFNVLGSLRDG